jgi:hypothetical protein
MNDARPTVLAALFCDEVRKEHNGKEILIGVYPGSILMPSLPTPLLISFWLYLQPNKVGELKLEFRVLGPDESVLVYFEGAAEFSTADDTGSFSFPRIPMRIEKECILQFQWRLPRGDWETLAKKPVNINRSASAS